MTEPFMEHLNDNEKVAIAFAVEVVQLMRTPRLNLNDQLRIGQAVIDQLQYTRDAGLLAGLESLSTRITQHVEQPQV